MTERINTCPICGGARFSWGTLQGSVQQAPVGFRPDQEGTLRKMFSYPFLVRVRRCLDCNNLQQFLTEKGTK